MYKYVKAPPGHTLKKPMTLGKKLRLGISAIFLTIGIAAFTSVGYPMLVYHVSYAPKLVDHTTPLAPPVKADEPVFVKEMINTTFDYTDSTTWFPEATLPVGNNQDTDLVYTFSIPKLGIKDALVRNDHTDLKKTLIQYPGTAMPGDFGNTVIFGHSVLPQFFNPKNYTTIFSTLHTLEPGDKIIIAEGGATYTYQITEMYSVSPDNLSPLAQTYDRHSLTVITCTPPGTYLKRLIVKAELI